MNKKCHICNNTFKDIIHFKSHIKETRKTYKEIKVDFFSISFPLIATKENLILNYLNRKKSILDIVEEFSIKYGQIEMLIDFYNIKKRNLSEAAKLAKKKYRATCKKRYGVINVSQIKEVKNKVKQTFLKHYGVDNIRKSKKFNEWLTSYMLEKYGKKRITNGKKISKKRKKFSNKKWKEIHEKYRKTSLEKYGFDNIVKTDKVRKIISKKAKERWNNYSDEEKERRIMMLVLSNPKYKSKLEERVSKILNQNNISYSYQRYISKKSFDFKIGKIILEVNGDYWHANPKYYSAEDEISYPFGIEKAKNVWKKDIQKRKLAERYGYSVVYIWEDEMKNKDDETLEKFLLNRLQYYEN